MSHVKRKDIQQKLDKILPCVEKPGRYIGKEWNSIEKEWSNDKLLIALSFPETYEIGMSHLGLNLLYNILNKRSWIVAERVYAPWVDMEKMLKEYEIPLFTLESKTSLKEFDIVAFTLQYELTYTNVLNTLHLSGIPVKKKERTDHDPLIIAGGPNAFMPEPLADFIDVFVIGEGEEVIIELMERIYNIYKNMDSKSIQKNLDKQEILEELKDLKGVYIPEFYRSLYDENGCYQGLEPLHSNVPSRIIKNVIKDLDKTQIPEKPLVPNIEIVHDRAAVELFRGCGKGCRFCQAGMVYRPVRERSMSKIKEIADKFLKETGYEEISLTSLSTADYSEIESLVNELNDCYSDESVSISLPSLRIDSFSIDLLKKVQKVKKTGLTFAPEAGSERLRNVINKKVTEKNLLDASRAAFESGWHTLKLYFMLGLPTETYDDLDAMVNLVQKVQELYKQINKNTKRLKLNVSTSIYVPKPHTPFQWKGQITMDEMNNRQNYLREKLKSKSINFSWSDPETSYIEAFLAKGDRKCGETIYRAFMNGAKFDGWGEMFDFKIWEKAFEESEVDPYYYVNRDINLEEKLPWDHINSGVSKDYLKKEYQKALNEKTTIDCPDNEKCDICGVCSELI
ncbi:TIGR03960 family B12-binding radical SAM protein [Natranaerofaba carboxydovora]|uniref:TIGR03960 family B12-binding radical SAM protein n=1 Tax=Natranaerofaba carboxydovora TaxID=2742683 RepID=UPI001F13DBB2|nr:TIGR03960 family B12-binding radical SAM protein [Natranaerofaba carboxydovora]UMZ72878.1 Radical SAM superfamily protein [Natranaerofaba carboxydovora]